MTSQVLTIGLVEEGGGIKKLVQVERLKAVIMQKNQTRSHEWFATLFTSTLFTFDSSDFGLTDAFSATEDSKELDYLIEFFLSWAHGLGSVGKQLLL